MPKANNTVKYTLKAQAANNDTDEQYTFTLQFYVFPEDGQYIAYCPSFDLTTSGKDYLDAVKNFYECFQLHTEWCIDNGTLIDDLKQHGWKMKAGRPQPPTFRSLLAKPEMSRIVAGQRDYQSLASPMQIPLAAVR